MRVEQGLQALRRAGLVLQASVPVGELPRWADEPMRRVGIDPARYQSLLMFGQGGKRLWDFIVAEGRFGRNPFDEMSERLAGQLVTDYLDDVAWEMVYPGAAMLPLGRLADHVGWGGASPLGLTINGEYGLWVAHRAVLLVDADVSIEPAEPFPHPCDSCVDKPCVSACPAGAVSIETGFAIDPCMEHRIEPGSSCAYQCLSRNSCPVGTEHRYGPAQMTHHYASGLESIRGYYESEASP
ncbi:MAG: hypothetical protein HKN91_03595 [Acidimicrobiia bacterium]|nr:hypothetical protein [Acidimicrobiia bacterium]